MSPIVNVLSIDVEDYFHPSEVQRGLSPDRWKSLPSRVESSTGRLLDLLQAKSVRGTFFILGWVAEQYPALVRRIAEAGHEVACHSYAHQLIYDLTPARFREDTMQAVDAIGNACGVRPRAYRAPSFSVTEASRWALEVLVECGFTHDSSIYPISHDRYGIPGFSRQATVVETASGPILEVPVAAVELSQGHITPVGGGGYLRMLPYCYTAAGIRRLHRENIPACMYMHPWEFDPEQPRVAKGLLSALRTYTGVRGMERKLARLLDEFRFSTLADAFPQCGNGPLRPNPHPPGAGACGCA